jgi:hypothetical protein
MYLISKCAYAQIQKQMSTVFVQEALDGKNPINDSADCLHTKKPDTFFTPLQW